MALILRVLAPIAGDDVQPAVAIQITGSDSVPPASQVGECRVLSVECRIRGWYKREVRFGESAMIVVEDPDRAPFAGQDQFRESIAIQIAPDRTADHSNVLKQFGIGCI